MFTRFPIGEYVHDELEARGWTVAEFALWAGILYERACMIASPGFRDATAEDCYAIGRAFNTNPDLWLRLAGLRD